MVNIYFLCLINILVLKIGKIIKYCLNFFLLEFYYYKVWFVYFYNIFLKELVDIGKGEIRFCNI